MVEKIISAVGNYNFALGHYKLSTILQTYYSVPWPTTVLFVSAPLFVNRDEWETQQGSDHSVLSLR